MVNQQLLDYIKQQTQQGISKEQIKSSLIANNWEEQDIDEAFSLVPNFTDQSPAVSSSTSTQVDTLLPGATTIFSQAWAIYKQRFGTLLGIMVIPILITAISFAVLVGGEFLITGGIGLFLLLVILFFVIIPISQVWGQIALLYAIKDVQERIGIIESYRRGWRKIISYWWISLLAGFIILGGFLLLVVPGIVLMVWFSLALFVLVAEDLKGMDALLKSKEYIKGKWIGVLWRLFFIVAISLIISFISSFLFIVLKVPFGSKISNFIVGLFLTPLTMTYLFLVYRNLKSIKGEVVFAPNKGKKAIFIFIGILGTLLIPIMLFSTVFLNLNSAREKARDARRRADVTHIQLGLEIYYDKNNQYPFSLDELSPNYLLNTPVDPSTGQSYQYQLDQDSEDYTLCTQFEATKIQECNTSQSRSF